MIRKHGETMTTGMAFATLVACCGGLLTHGAGAGTVTLTKSDAYGETSLLQGPNWSDSLAPHADADYVVPAGLSIRTSNNIQSGTRVFAGNSLTLEAGGTLVTKHMSKAIVRIPDLRLAGGATIKEANGTDNGFLDGAFTILGTVDTPVLITGTAENASRWIKLPASLAGAETSAISIKSADKAERKAYGFHVRLLGDNAAYGGRFLCTANAYHDIGLAVGHENALGAGSADFPVVTLSRQAAKYDVTLWGLDGYRFDRAAYTLAIDDGASIGAMSGDDAGVGLVFDGGAHITGSGELRIKKWRGFYDWSNPCLLPASEDAVVFKEVSIDKTITLSVSPEAHLVLKDGYANADVPVTVENGGALSVTCESLSVPPGRAALVSTGAITKEAATRLVVTFDPLALCRLAEETTVNVLSAPNLGTADGLTLDDFAFDVSWATEFASAFSIQDHTLVLTRPAITVVYKTGADNASTQSWAAKHNWSDGAKPSAGKTYVVSGPGMVLRTPEYLQATFAGEALVVEKNGWFSLMGGTATVDDFRMGAGGYLRPGRDERETSTRSNNLAGNGTVYAPRTNPFKISCQGGTAGNWRVMNVAMNLSGEGDLLVECAGEDLKVNGVLCATKCNSTSNEVNVTGSNRLFTGGMTVSRPENGVSLIVDFADEAAMGGPAAAFRADRLKFVNNPTWRCSKSYAMTDPTRGVTIDNGLTVNVFADQTLSVSNPITGSGKIAKTGAGTLALSGDNTMTAKAADDIIAVREGRLTLGSVNALNARPLSFGSSGSSKQPVLRLATADGVRVLADATKAFIQTGAARPKLEIAAFETMNRAEKKTVRVFRYKNATALDEGSFAAVFDTSATVNPARTQLIWGTETLTEGAEYAVTLVAKPRGFFIILR